MEKRIEIVVVGGEKKRWKKKLVEFLLFTIGMFKKSYDATGRRVRCKGCRRGRQLVVQSKRNMLNKLNRPPPMILDCPGIFPPEDVSLMNTFKRMDLLQSRTVEIFGTYHSQCCTSKLK